MISNCLDRKTMNGFVTNCYREHTFCFVDFLNNCHPEGKVIHYTKKELIQTEKDCQEYNYGKNE